MHMDGAWDTLWIKSQNGTFLALQIKAFGQKKIWFSCMSKKVPFWQFLKILKNCQNGTFLPLHEILNFFGPNAFIWSAKKVPFRDFIQKMSQALSKCLSKWIKMDKWNYLKNPSSDLENSFCLRFLWIPRKTGRQDWRGPIFLGFDLIE